MTTVVISIDRSSFFSSPRHAAWGSRSIIPSKVVQDVGAAATAARRAARRRNPHAPTARRRRPLPGRLPRVERGPHLGALRPGAPRQISRRVSPGAPLLRAGRRHYLHVHLHASRWGGPARRPRSPRPRSRRRRPVPRALPAASAAAARAPRRPTAASAPPRRPRPHGKVIN